MEAETAITRNSLAPEPFQNPPRTRKKDNYYHYLWLIIFILIIPVLPPLITPETDQKPTKPPSNPLFSDPNPVIRAACSATLYPSLCLSTLSLSTDNTALHHLLELSINQTINLVSTSLPEIIDFYAHNELKSQENSALNDCLDMLDQTLYELSQAMGDLQISPLSFGNLKTLLSAAMTNEHTCIDGFSDLEQIESKLDTQKDLRNYLEMKLSPIVRMISNSLAIIRHLEGIKKEQEGFPLNNQWRASQVPKSKTGYPPWMTRRERRLMGRRNLPIKPNAVVAGDGSGDYRTVGEAVKMAPNISGRRYVIKIKAGIYKENVEIPRNKVNLMLMGDGMNSTLISGSRSLLDGFSTFASATLTVIGDRFLARDLTIENTASPEKHQAVALRVTSNAAFYRCNFTSYQDTLYAHSLRQFYRECTVQGTIDFIFGNAAAIFQNCLILARKPIPGQSNMITAQSRDDPNQNTGFSLQNCTIKAAPDFSLMDRRRSFTYLGRPWRNYSRTIIMKSYLGDLIHPKGWSEWDEYSTLDTVEYIEYMNFGPGSNTRYRVRWGGYKKNYTEELAKRFTIGAFLHGSDDWLQTTGFPLYHGS